MLSAHLVPLITQLLIPLGMLAWHGLRHDRNRASAMARIAFIAGYLSLIALVGLWLIMPWFIWIVYFIVLGAESFTRTSRLRAVPWRPTGRRAWLGAMTNSVLAGATLAVIGHVINGWTPPREPIVDLAFPLRSGTYYVANGGSNELVSAHVQTLTGERFRNYRGQSYGVDLVKLDRWSRRARGLAPRDPRDYVIFGEAIYAPCSGAVLRAQGGLPDLSPPEVDRGHMPGNFVLLECAGVQVLLAHMEHGSVNVEPGDQVTPENVIGRVGNTGNSSEPHLHVHAQRPAVDDAFLSGDPLPIRLNGRFLVRNDRIEQPAKD
jgi:peptidase M23-like protein